MEKRANGIRKFGIALIVYGVINLFGFANFGEFKQLLTGLSNPLIISIYGFGIGYSIICIKCGSSILKLEEWARKTAVIFVMASLLFGLFVTPIMMRNLLDTMIKSATFFTVVFTLFEMGFVFYFTRSKVKERFRKGEIRGNKRE